MQAIAKVKIWIVILMIFCGKNIMPFFWVTWNEPYVEAPFSVEGSHYHKIVQNHTFLCEENPVLSDPGDFPGGHQLSFPGTSP